MLSGNTLFVFHTRQQADYAGFKGERHPQRRDWQAWWPSLGERPLRARRFSTMILSSYAIPFAPDLHIAIQRSEQIFGDQFTLVRF